MIELKKVANQPAASVTEAEAQATVEALAQRETVRSISAPFFDEQQQRWFADVRAQGREGGELSGSYSLGRIINETSETPAEHQARIERNRELAEQAMAGQQAWDRAHARFRQDLVERVGENQIRRAEVVVRRIVNGNRCPDRYADALNRVQEEAGAPKISIDLQGMIEGRLPEQRPLVERYLEHGGELG